MAREVKPCGTFAAYLRHKRKGEEVCGPCAQAARDQKNGRSSKKRDESAEVFQLEAASEPVPVEVDEVSDARENLALVRAAMTNAAPRELPALSKRRQELVERIAMLERKSSSKGGGVLDEIAQRRKDRLANTAN